MIPLLVKCFHSSSFRGLVNRADASLSALKISKGTGCFICLVHELLHFMKSQVQCQTKVYWWYYHSGCSICRVMEAVQKSSHTSGCFIRCFWNWSPHHTCCWLNSSLKSDLDLDQGKSLQTQCSDESDDILCSQLLVVKWLTFQLCNDTMLCGVWEC
jgi:hypothetical protein